jgi:DNA-binding MarR family transcriptional regulator
MVKDSRQGSLPPGLPDDALHHAASVLHSAALRLLRRARTADVEMDLDGPRASLLSVLVFRGPLPVTRLAAIEQVSPPAITKLVGALERSGLAERRRSPEDRRVVFVAATAAGRELLERGRAARVALIADVLAGLTVEELRAVGGAADTLGAALATRPPGSS